MLFMLKTNSVGNVALLLGSYSINPDLMINYFHFYEAEIRTEVLWL